MWKCILLPGQLCGGGRTWCAGLGRRAKGECQMYCNLYCLRSLRSSWSSSSPGACVPSSPALKLQLEQRRLRLLNTQALWLFFTRPVSDHFLAFVRQSVICIGLVETCWCWSELLDLSKLLHGFLLVETWICENWYMDCYLDSSILIHGFF